MPCGGVPRGFKPYALRQLLFSRTAGKGGGCTHVTPTDNETTNGLGVHESRARATANPAASTHNNELNTHDE